MSVCWEPATVGEESVASTQRARSVARERSAAGLAMNSLITTTAKVSQPASMLPLPLFVKIGLFLFKHKSCDFYSQILMSVRLASITVAPSFSAKTPRGRSAVSRRSSAAQALFRMPLGAALVSCQLIVLNKSFIATMEITENNQNFTCLFFFFCLDINECVSETGSCHRGQVCINTVGSYICQRNSVNCGRGYHLNEEGTRCVGMTNQLNIPTS